MALVPGGAGAVEASGVQLVASRLEDKREVNAFAQEAGEFRGATYRRSDGDGKAVIGAQQSRRRTCHLGSVGWASVLRRTS